MADKKQNQQSPLRGDEGRSPGGPKDAPERIPGQNRDLQPNTEDNAGIRNVDADDVESAGDRLDNTDRSRSRGVEEVDDEMDQDDLETGDAGDRSDPADIGANTSGDLGANLSQPAGDGNYQRVGDRDTPIVGIDGEDD